MREDNFGCTIGRSCLALLVACILGLRAPPACAQQAAPTDAAASAALAADIDTLVSQFAAQRDAIGGFPAGVQTNYDHLTQLQAQLDEAAAAGDLKLTRQRNRACLRVAGRISRWLINHYEPSNDQPPTGEKLDAVVARLLDRLTLVTALAAHAGVTPDFGPANAARQQLDQARGNGNGAQLQAAARALRDAIDALQDAIPDPAD